jgi:hypothetical protein
MSETVDLQRLVVSLEAKLTQFDKAMASANKSANTGLANIERRFRVTESELARFGRGFAASLNPLQLLAGFTAGAAVDSLKSAVGEVAKLADDSKRAGVGVEKLQRLFFAFRRGGGESNDTLIGGMAKLNLELGQAGDKSSELGRILTANKIKLSDLGGDPVNALLKIADLIKNARSEQDKAVIGNAAFGKGWKDMLPFIQQGSGAIIAAMKEIDPLTEKMVAEAKRIDDQWSAIADHMATNWHRAAVTMAGDLEVLWQSIAKGRLPHFDWNNMGSFGPHLTTGGGGSPPMSTRGGVGPTQKTVLIDPTVTQGSIPGQQLSTQFEKDLQKLADQMDLTRDATRGFIGDLVSGLKESKSLTEALTNALSQLADKLMDRSLDQLVSVLLGPRGGTSAGLVGSLIYGYPSDRLKAVPGPGAGLSSPMVGLGDSIVSNALGALPRSVANVPYGSIIQAAASKYRADPNIIAALIQHESNFNPTAANPHSSALGLTQLLSGTARDLGVTDRTDPTQSIFGGTKYYAQQFARFGNVRDALAAYEQGPGGDLTKGYGYADAIINQSKVYASAVASTAQTAQAASGGFQSAFPSALSNVLSAVGGKGGPGGGLFNSLSSLISLGSTFHPGVGTRAEGGPVEAGRPYVVGEHRPELFVPSVPGVIVPRIPNQGSQGGFQIHVTKSPYFDVHVTRIAAAGDARTLDTARRSYPEVAARFNKLGTTSR